MSGCKNWDGFDYRNHEPVTWPRPKWREVIRHNHRTQRVRDGSLLIYTRTRNGDRIMLEVYDREREALKGNG